MFVSVQIKSLFSCVFRAFFDIVCFIMRSKKQKKNVIISFRIANVAGIGTFAGTLRYLRTLANWKVHLFTSQAELSPEIVDSAAKDGIDGILIDHPLHETLADALLRSRIPLVSIGTSDNQLFKRRTNVAFLEIDSRKIGEMGARHFLSLGHFRSFGFLPDIPRTRWSMMRLRGFAMELRKHGHTVNVYQSAAPHATDRYRTDLANWFKSLSRPAAVMLAGDYHVMNAFEACAAANLSIPENVAILGVDNDPALCDSTSPSLSSIEPPFENEGFEAAALLDKMMRSRKQFTRPIIMRFAPTRIVERESTGYLAPGAHLIDRANDFISNNCCTAITARDVAVRLGVSQALLARRFQQYADTTVREAIIAARMKNVCTLLKTTRLPILRIASRCGFASANRLTHFFTLRFGMSPRAYRASAGQGSEKHSPAP